LAQLLRLEIVRATQTAAASAAYALLVPPPSEKETGNRKGEWMKEGLGGEKRAE